MVTRIEFSKEQAELAYRIENVAAMAAAWAKAEQEARAKVADPERSLSSFTIDDLTAAAGTAEARHDIAAFLAKIAPHVVVAEGRYKILEFVDGPAVTEVVALFANMVTSRVARFYKPNSTSTSDVEIKLYTYEAYNTLRRTLDGNY